MSLIIFDLDGVLVDTKDIHYEALNRALPENARISYEDHLNKFDGLPTKAKLDILYDEGKIRGEDFARIYRDKQMYTATELENIPRSNEIDKIFVWLKANNHKVAIASNSIRPTVFACIRALGIYEYVDYVMSNEDVGKPKPFPAMYWQTMIHFGIDPEDTYVFEDSSVGRLAASRSGANLVPVGGPEDLTLDFVVDALQGKRNPIKWIDKKLNVLIPMAGKGSRFADAGYTFPKPLIEVRGKPMIQAVVENLNIDANYIYVVQTEHYNKYNLGSMLNLITPGCKIISLGATTQGAAETTLMADEYIDNEAPLLIANSDQLVEWDSNEVMYSFMSSHADAGMLTFKNLHPKWSYAKIEGGWVTQVAEKNPISDNATVGIYYWKHGSDYVKSVLQMMDKNIRTNNEFYVAPAFNEAIENGLKVKATQIEKMWGIGTPEDLTYYLENS
jgi:HAD superfamily hydrolase (TIGR01509 family)